MNERIIKFRVWDERAKRFCDEDQAEIRFDHKQQITRVMEFYDVHGNQLLGELFTGLLDKNGKEIYEGDIVESYWKGTKEKANPPPMAVIYKGVSFGLSAYHLSFYEDLDYKVIGNIHENRNLLK